jgi:hypothetical protein
VKTFIIYWRIKGNKEWIEYKFKDESMFMFPIPSAVKELASKYQLNDEIIEVEDQTGARMTVQIYNNGDEVHIERPPVDTRNINVAEIKKNRKTKRYFDEN